MENILIFLLSIFLVAGCTSTKIPTHDEMGKLDPQLKQLFTGDKPVESDYTISYREDGSKEYGVIIRSSNVSEIRAAGIPVGSVFGDVITARLTLVELRRVLALPSVRAVQNSSKDKLH